MGNEMGNNNTSELREEDNTIQDKSQQEVAHADDLEGQNHEVSATLDEDSQGKETWLASGDVQREDPKVDDQKRDNTEEDDMKTEVKKSLQEASQTDDVKGKNHEVPASEDKYKNEKETGLASVNLEEVADSHDDNYKQDKKEGDSNMIPEAKEKSLQEVAKTDEANGQDHVVPQAEDRNTHGNEPELVSSEPDGIASPHVDNRKQDEKEEDNSTNLEAEEKSLQEATSTDDKNAQADLVLVAGDENTHGIETGLVSSGPDGMACLPVDNQTQDVKEEDININDEAGEKSSLEAACTDAEEKSTCGNETELVSIYPEEIVDPHVDNPKQDEEEEDNPDAEPQEKPLAKDVHADDIGEKNLTIPVPEDGDCTIREAEEELPSGDSMLTGDILDDQILEGREQDKIKLHPPAESAKVEAKLSEAVDEGMEIQPASSSNNLEDHEMQQELNSENNLSGTGDHFENQDLVTKEDEGTRNSISDAASATSHDSVPQEPVVVEPGQYELAKIHTEQVVQVCNGSQKSVHMIKPSLTCPIQENGFILDSSISADMVKSVLADPSPEVEKEMDDISEKEMATNEMSSEEKFELKDGDGTGTDLPNGFGAKCNGELPSEMNSIKNDSPNSQVEAILLAETQNFQLEVSETEDKGLVFSHKALLVSEELEDGDSKQPHCHIQSIKELIEKSNVMESENGSMADEPNEFLPQFMMNWHPSEDKRCLIDTCCDSESSKDCQLEEAKTVKNEATEEQQKATDPALISACTFLSVQKYKEEESESEEKKIMEEMVGRTEDFSNPIGNDRRESREQCISHSYPTEQAEALLSPSLVLHALPENHQQDSLFSPTEASSVVTKNLTDKPLTTAETKPSLQQSSEQCANGKMPAVANGDYNQQESVGRLSTESNSDNMIIHGPMRKSPSFDLDVRIDARAEESDQAPLLYQEKTTIESFSSQADVSHGKPVANTEYGKKPLQYEAMPAEEKVVALERSDSEKSKTPFLGFLKEEEEAAAAKKQDNHSSAKKATKVSPKGKEKRKPRTSLFGTCMCCATVIN